ncbi:hypothetical protein [Chromobacterium haemolyticum]|uniref:hypothetical protein n=1 Tax=Chromobacterium haemolyticum TaxID=394935 RepID=UPI00112FE57A|nr:hypothetical protein [Chromobacterium haemolyticum]
MSNVERISVVVVSVIILLMVLVIAWMAATSSTRVAKSLLKNAVLDIDSAKFENVYWNNERNHICGSVNAKNRMGAYVGWQRFVVPYWPGAEGGKGFYASLAKLEDNDPGEFFSAWNRLCNK